jgi:hypothetical protein
MNYQIEIVASAVHDAYCREDTEVSEVDRAEAKTIVDYLYEHGWFIGRTEDEPLDEHVSSGPIQRALGIENAE